MSETYLLVIFCCSDLFLSFDVELPPECDDEYWEPTDSKQAFTQPEGIPSKISYWNSYLKLIEICGFALLTIVSDLALAFVNIIQLP